MNYKTTKVAEGVYAIIEEGYVQCYLIEGSERAVLFDSCASGGEEFKEAVAALTAKPIQLVISHSDEDHTAGQGFFDTPFIHPAENARYFAHGNAGKEVLPLWEGDKIDLGGTVLETVLIPGHTPGSIALLDRSARRLFIGDTVSDAWIYMFDDGRDLRAYIESLRKLEAMSPAIDTIHSAHGSLVLQAEWLTKTRIAAEKLLAGELETKSPPEGLPCKLYSYEGVHLLYAER